MNNSDLSFTRDENNEYDEERKHTVIDYSKVTMTEEQQKWLKPEVSEDDS